MITKADIERVANAHPQPCVATAEFVSPTTLEVVLPIYPDQPFRATVTFDRTDRTALYFWSLSLPQLLNMVLGSAPVLDQQAEGAVKP